MPGVMRRRMSVLLPPPSREPVQKMQLLEAVYHESAHLFSQAEL
ncbi:hypothetical protein HKBW3S34_02486, partial [Candidatus Hakubella thermalkaliphila]